jgi:hypothetical protein
MNASACAVFGRSHSLKHHLECFYSIHFERTTTSQIALSVICHTRLSIWTVITTREISMTAVITVVIYANIKSTTYYQQVLCFVICICPCCLVNFEYVLVIELNDKCIFIFNPSIILRR